MSAASKEAHQLARTTLLNEEVAVASDLTQDAVDRADGLMQRSVVLSHAQSD